MKTREKEYEKSKTPDKGKKNPGRGQHRSDFADLEEDSKNVEELSVGLCKVKVTGEEERLEEGKSDSHQMGGGGNGPQYRWHI